LPIIVLGYPLTTEFARRLRREQTDFERRLWRELRNRRFSGFKFRRQQPIGPFIVDFISFEAGLVIELDGSQHGLPERLSADETRTEYLESRGYRVLRVWNGELVDNFNGVMEAIFCAARRDNRLL
jgi:very-short-patch-repair endonuclease